jgi:hypothetical protein
MQHTTHVAEAHRKVYRGLSLQVHFTERLQTFSRAYDSGAISDLLDSCRQLAFRIFQECHIHHITVTFSAQLIISRPKMFPNLTFPFATRKHVNKYTCTTQYLSYRMQRRRHVLKSNVKRAILTLLQRLTQLH